MTVGSHSNEPLRVHPAARKTSMFDRGERCVVGGLAADRNRTKLDRRLVSGVLLTDRASG